MIKPPMPTWSPVWTNMRVERLRLCAGAVGLGVAVGVGEAVAVAVGVGVGVGLSVPLGMTVVSTVDELLDGSISTDA